MKAEQGGYMAGVGQKGTDGQDWQQAQEEVVSGARQLHGLDMSPRLCELSRGPRSPRVAIVAYDESVY